MTAEPVETSVMIDMGLLGEHELEDRRALARAYKAAVRMWAEDRRRWLDFLKLVLMRHSPGDIANARTVLLINQFPKTAKPATIH